MSVKQVLRQCDVFATLSEAELEQVSSFAVEKEYEAGSIVFHEKDNAEELLVIEDGRIALQMTVPVEPGGIARKVTVDVAARGDVVGWSVFVEPYTRNFTAVCLQNARVVAINGASLRALFRENNQVGYKVMKELIKVAGARLDDTRRVLVSERLLTGTR
ncbi:MAG: cyclic nucleotide-binding domain-containing protein [Chloroflexi bacterium]|nr:cyclic nucleotide-binding domain-containing protein [Chloroflexota bacterium]